MRDIAEAALVSVTEAEFAAARRAEGAQVVLRGGVHWEQVGARGFYQPVHLLRRLSLDEARAAPPWGWGHRAVLRPGDAGAANGTLPIIRPPDLARYDEFSLQRRRRSCLRGARQRVRLVQLTDLGLLAEQGHELVRDSLARTGHRAPPSRAAYADKLRHYARGRHWCVLAGLIDGRLGGYGDAYVVDGVAYAGEVYYASWALPSNLPTLLNFEVAMLCRRTPGVHTFVNGLETPEHASLMLFKRTMGLVVDHLPVRWHMLPPARAVVRRWRPHAFYRLTGQAPGRAPSGPGS
ncbi:hypothetical protein [Deinococcus aestuarii]|uniref:hypothetical protein n=1 Tax=Deinococcus aestuarii TaxID=2774531 RepID=UPI001C0AEDA9|nr:hypothetical protein [Deinococcus aestuarii]